MILRLNRAMQAAFIAFASLAITACDSASSEPDSGPGFEVIDFTSGTGTVWANGTLTVEEFEALEVPTGWIKNQPREATMDAAVFLRSPSQTEDGEFTQQEMYGHRWVHVATVVSTDGPIDDEGLLNAATVAKFHEITFWAGTTVTTLTSPEGDRYVMVSRDYGRTTDTPTIPEDWTLESAPITEELRIMLPEQTTVIRADNEDSFQGPI